jgi:hypothetical protein
MAGLQNGPLAVAGLQNGPLAVAGLQNGPLAVAGLPAMAGLQMARVFMTG